MIGILGIVVIIVAAVLAYRTANQYERSGIAWAGIVLGVGFGIQIALPTLAITVVMIVMAVGGGNQLEILESVYWPATIIGYVCLFLSVVAVMLILKHLSKVPEDESFTAPPVPPESF